MGKTANEGVERRRPYNYHYHTHRYQRNVQAGTESRDYGYTTGNVPRGVPVVPVATSVYRGLQRRPASYQQYHFVPGQAYRGRYGNQRRPQLQSRVPRYQSRNKTMQSQTEGHDSVKDKSQASSHHSDDHAKEEVVTNGPEKSSQHVDDLKEDGKAKTESCDTNGLNDDVSDVSDKSNSKSKSSGREKRLRKSTTPVPKAKQVSHKNKKDTKAETDVEEEPDIKETKKPEKPELKKSEVETSTIDSDSQNLQPSVKICRLIPSQSSDNDDSIVEIPVENENTSEENVHLTEIAEEKVSAPTNEGMSAKEKTPAKERTLAKESTPARERTPAKEKTPAKERTPAREKTPAKERTPAKEKTPAKERTPAPESSSNVDGGRDSPQRRTRRSMRCRTPNKTPQLDSPSIIILEDSDVSVTVLEVSRASQERSINQALRPSQERFSGQSIRPSEERSFGESLRSISGRKAMRPLPELKSYSRPSAQTLTAQSSTATNSNKTESTSGLWNLFRPSGNSSPQGVSDNEECAFEPASNVSFGKRKLHESSIVEEIEQDKKRLREDNQTSNTNTSGLFSIMTSPISLFASKLKGNTNKCSTPVQLLERSDVESDNEEEEIDVEEVSINAKYSSQMEYEEETLKKIQKENLASITEDVDTKREETPRKWCSIM